MSHDTIRFPGALGAQLSGILDMPLGERPRAFVLFAHCFTGSKNMRAVVDIARALNDHNIAMLRFDFTGLGQSDGDFAQSNFSSNVRDILAAANFLRRKYKAPQILMGHSLGGTAMLAAARQVPEARAIAVIGSPSDSEHVTHLFAEALPEIKAKGEAVVDLAGRPFTIRQHFVDDLANQQMEDNIARLNKALLILHSPGDETVGIDNAQRIYDLAQHPKSLVSLDTADHLLMNDSRDAEYAAQTLAAWAERYIA